MTTSTSIDLVSSTSYENGHPFEQYAWLRHNDPVHWHESTGPGFWAVTRHADIKAISRDRNSFTSTEGTTLWDLDEVTMEAGRRMMLMMDPPEHTTHRRLVQDRFTRSAAQAMQHSSRDIARSIIDEVCERGSCDFVSDVVGHMPLFVMADLLGFPRVDSLALYDDICAVHGAADAVTDQERAGAAQAIFDFSLQVAAVKRKSPGDDLTSLLLSADVGDRRLTEEEFASFFWLLLNAGGDTVRNGLGGGLLALLDNPAQWHLVLEGGEAVLPGAVEEIIRWTSPVVHMRRTTTSEVVIGERTLAAGERVVMFYGSGNRDESVFDEPDRFDVTRDAVSQIAFGAGGVHLCLGAALARSEMSAMLDEVTRRLPDIHLAGDVEWHPSNYVIGPATMPVAYTPATRQA